MRTPVAAGVLLALLALPAVGGAVCTRRTPLVTLTPASITLAQGQSVALSATLKNRDSRGCAPAVFAAVPLAFATEPQTCPELPLGAGAAQTVLVAPGEAQRVWEVTLHADVDALPGEYATAVFVVPVRRGELGKPAWVLAAVKILPAGAE